MPWEIASRLSSFRDAPSACPECRGSPPDWGNGFGECSTCGAILVAADPAPGELITTTLVPVDERLKPLPARRRKTIQIREGWKCQADGTLARIYRLIDKQNDHYTESVRRDGKVAHHVDEPLTKHRGHGSARNRSRLS